MTTLQWGIMGAGAISAKFAKDCLIDPSTRNVSDVGHRIAAVASRDASKAQSFINAHCGEASYKSEIKALGSYKALVQEPEVHAVYIGTPHSHHYDNTKLCLNSGKHVLCEKPLTVNAAQAKGLFALAREKNLFLMEAVWTRFFPLTHELQRIVASGEIGEILQVVADLSINFGVDDRDPGHRMVDPHLAGGAMLDLGPYPWTHIALTLLHQHLKPAGSAFAEHAERDLKKTKYEGDALPLSPALDMPKISASVTKYHHPKVAKDLPDVDGSTLAVLEFPTPSGATAQGVFIASMRTHTRKDCAVAITGTRGTIRIPFPPYRPEKFYVTSHATDNEAVRETAFKQEEKLYDFPLPGGGTWGFVWEADEVARCVAAGKVESPRMPHRETILMMEVFDEMRKQGGIRYPESIERTS